MWPEAWLERKTNGRWQSLGQLVAGRVNGPTPKKKRAQQESWVSRCHAPAGKESARRIRRQQAEQMALLG
ncbi:hypothetical protein NDU88_002759 [Pleurodeles waltl]|uniref:Uncharacterized protein n=1 Tax=Pleurodeles waltl TaxID=8319 RepID=A0AAV7RAX2_PLEWA|nr:hypothetical protein NDU88_002759 [Pleurodeles waltl]